MAEKVELKHDFIKIETDKGVLYGYDQNRFKSKRLQGYACGPVAVSNILAYEKFSRNGKPVIGEDEYLNIYKKLSFFIPVIPRFGVNGIMMTIGLNLYFWLHGRKSFAYWGMTLIGFFRRIKRSLEKDEPVVLAVGPNFPNLFGKKTIGVYVKTENGYRKAWQTRAHYVTVVGMDDEWFKISTWGNEAYINKKEFIDYARWKSLPLFSNIMVIH